MIKKLASMLMAGAMCVSLGAALNVSAEGERYAKSSDYVSEKVTKGSDDVYYFSHGYDYIGFKNVDFTGMKSVEITGICNMLGSRDGDKVQIRIDSDKGQLLGYVDFGIHDPGKIKIFKGSIDSVTGVHDLYFVSSFSTSSSVGIKSFVLSKDEYINKYEPIPDSAVIDNHSSTWTFTDDLGRRAADYEEVGPIRGDKYVGIFYWTWHNNFETLAPLNMSEFAKLHPEAKYDFTNVAWPGGVAHFWNEPMFGYYAGIDYWVYRKHAQMLADAGVDVLLFDTTNGTNTWRREYQVLFKALIDARKNGLDTPKVAFISNFAPTNTSSKENITRTYMNAYMDGKYSDLWFYWKGKPLIMANTDQLKARDGDAADSQLMDEIKNFFTFRSPQPSYVTGDTTGTQWGWLEVYPKHGFYKKADGSYEQATVGVAANHSYETHTITAMNNPYLTGRSYTNELGNDCQDGAYKYGWFFKEQLKSAIDIDPEFMFITGWNEWIAGRYETWGGVLNASPDEYDNDGSRDMEPTKGDMKDDYYCLLVDSVRKFKGAEKLEAAGAAKTINMNDSKAWEGVTPEFINDKGTYNRDSVGYKGCNYKNDTARNNVIVSKVSRDSQYMYFYAKCAEKITPASDADWMKLYINTDRNRATGWEGYDFVINGNGAGTVCTLGSDYKMTTASNAEYILNGDTLQIKVSRSLLGLGGTLDFEFKWADNAGTSGDILDFYSNGNCAPMGRLNYRYTEKEQTSISEGNRTNLLGTTIVKDGSNRGITSGAKMFVYEPDLRYTAKRINGVMYIPAALCDDTLGLRVEWDAERQMLKLRSSDVAIRIIAGDNELRVNGVYNIVKDKVITIDNLPYVPVTLLQQSMNLNVYNNGNICAFGKNIDTATVDAVSNQI